MQRQARGLEAVLESRAAPSHSSLQDQPDRYFVVAFPLNRWQAHSCTFASKSHFGSKAALCCGLTLLSCTLWFFPSGCNFVVLLGFLKTSLTVCWDLASTQVTQDDFPPLTINPCCTQFKREQSLIATANEVRPSSTRCRNLSLQPSAHWPGTEKQHLPDLSFFVLPPPLYPATPSQWCMFPSRSRCLPHHSSCPGQTLPPEVEQRQALVLMI